MKTVHYKEYAQTLEHWQYLSGMMCVSLKCFRGLVRTPPCMLGGLVAAELSEAEFYITKALGALERTESYISVVRENAHDKHTKREYGKKS